MREPSIRALIACSGLLIAVAVAVTTPTLYFVVGFNHASETLAFKAQLNADRVAKYVYVHEIMWRYQRVRLAELIESPADSGPPVHQRIVDVQGHTVLDEAHEVSGPSHQSRAPVLVGDKIVAWLEATTSLQPLLVNTAWVGAASSLLGLLAWLTVRLLPLRVLDRTLTRLSTQSARFQAALDNMAQGLCLFDVEGRLIVHNHRFASMFGAPVPNATASTLLVDERIGQILSPTNLNQCDDLDEDAQELPDGRVIQVSRQRIPGQGWVATYDDITERRRSQNQLSHMARHDALTGLPNRVKFREHMEDALLRARRGSGGGMALLYLDLDGFKGVNDTFGHPAGDELLRAVAARLQECTRETDLVARLGGDEFAIVQFDANQPTDATALSERLVEVLRQSFDIGGQYIVIGTSIGIALADATATPEGLLRNADIALYRAKAGGRGTWRFFELEMDLEMQTRRTLEADLRRASKTACKTFQIPGVNSVQ